MVSSILALAFSGHESAAVHKIREVALVDVGPPRRDRGASCEFPAFRQIRDVVHTQSVQLVELVLACLLRLLIVQLFAGYRVKELESVVLTRVLFHVRRLLASKSRDGELRCVGIQ